MNFLYSNPLTLAFHYLSLYFYGTPLDTLQSEFATQDRQNDDPGALPETGHPKFDFIIVGGGSAGSVLAGRLSETNATVLLIEAGGDPFPLTSVPALAPTLLGNPNIDWASPVVPQKVACQALINQAPTWNRGKLLGGGSSLNYMAAMRGNPNDFDNWANKTGDLSWTYENLLPYFRKMENYDGFFPDDKYRGKGGPLQVSKQRYAPLQDEFLKAGQDLGYEVKDPNGFQTESVFPFVTTTKEGTRFSAHRAYVHPALHRPNLKVQLYSRVIKVIFQRNRAIGVTYVRYGSKHVVEARKEVILSAGAVGSPQILMLSGIGPAGDLERLGIRVRKDLPVGQSLQDHPYTVVGPFTVKNGTLGNLGIESLLEYIGNGSGPYSSLGLPGGAVIASSLGSPNWPDIYLSGLVYPITETSAIGWEQAYKFQPGVIQKCFKADYGKESFLIIVALALPRSRGKLKLRSRDPFDQVIIDPKYLTATNDLQILFEGAELTARFASTKSFQDAGINLTSSLFPGCENFKSRNDDYWRCHVTRWTNSMWHYSSTCRMGRVEGDPVAVVDPLLRVIGTVGLRVVDASIMPKVTNANTNLPVIVTAEKAADDIKKVWGLV